MAVKHTATDFRRLKSPDAPELKIRWGAEVDPPYLLDILVYIKRTSSRAIIIKITHTIDPTIKRDISAKGLVP